MTQVKHRKNFVAIADSHPYLVAEWHPTKNVFTPYDIAAGGKHIIWWVGKCTHVWDASIRDRAVKGFTCPYCSNQRLLVGYNDLQTVNPELAAEWHPTENTKLPSEVQAGSSQKAFWLGKCGHPWESVIARRHTSKSKCPVCLNRLIISGVNDLAALNPKLAAEWHPKNTQDITKTSAKTPAKVWWQCPSFENHVWEANVVDRATRNSGCPICSNNLFVEGVNDIATLHPELLEEWHPNNIIPPNKIISGSHMRVRWSCKNDKTHEWKALISTRLAGGTGCPICTNRVVKAGFNDFASLHPVLAAEWHPTLNTKLPTEVGEGCTYKAWWLCSKNSKHVWQSIVRNRVRGSGCTQCTGATTSKVEGEFRKWFSHTLKDVPMTHLTKVPIQGKQRKAQVDVLGTFKTKQVIVEYDGAYYHASKEVRDIAKTQAFLDNGYIVIRIREKSLPLLSFSHPNFFQISYKWSLKQTKVDEAGTIIMKWLESI